MSNKKDDDKLWDGKNFTFLRFDTKVKAELLKKGGKSLLKHWDGSYSSARLETFIADVFELEQGQEFDDSNIMQPAMYPDQWAAFVRSYFPGPFDPINVQKDTRPKIRHFRIHAMRDLVAAREAQTWEIVLSMMQEKCSPRTECRQLVEHQGSTIRALMRSNHGEHESEEIRSLKAAFNRGDVHQHGAHRPPFRDGENLLTWVTKFEDIRSDLADQLDDEAAKQGLDTDGDLSFENMREIMLQMIEDHTTEYDNVVAGLEKDIEYKDLREILLRRWKKLVRKTKSKRSFQDKRQRTDIRSITGEYEFKGKCYSCGEEGHRANDPVCPKFHLRQSRYKGKGKGKGKGRGRGGRGDWRSRSGRGKGKGGHGQKGCWTWLEKGHCYHGKIYEHTRVYRYTDVRRKGGDSNKSTSIRKNRFGTQSDTRESMPEMVVQERKCLKRKEM